MSDLVTAKGASTVVENLKPTLATPAAGITPSTFLAMVGIKNGTALTLAAPVANAMATLTSIAASNSSANVQAATALSSMNSFHASMGFGGTPNHAAFGNYLNQMKSHIDDAKELRQSTDFMANMKYSDLGGGITDLGSSADRGLSATLGSLSSAGAAMASTGTMYNGGDVKDFGSSLGMVKSLMDNKLASVTGVKRRLAAAGVPLSDLDNPIYKDKIDQVMSGITDPGAMSVVADQYDVAPEIAAGESSGNSTVDAITAELQAIIDRLNQFADSVRGEWISGYESVTSNAELSAYRDSFIASQDNKDYQAAVAKANEISTKEIKPLPNDEFKLQVVNFRNNDVETAINDANAAVQEFVGKGKALRAMFNSQEGLVTDATMTAKATGPNTLGDNITVGTSVPSTAMGADLSPGKDLPVNAGGIQSLGDLGNPAKLDPSATAGLTGGIAGLTTHLGDLGAGSIKNASAAGALFGQIQSVPTPLTAAAMPDLGGMIKSNQGMLDSLTGAGSGPLGLPSMTDFTQHLAGGPSITSFLQTVGTDAAGAISALTTSLSGAIGLLATAGVDTTTPVPNNLGSAMGFAKNLHKFGADTSGSGVSDILHNLANPATPEGEAIKASLAEGKNNKLLADNAIPPITTTPPPPAPGQSNVAYPITVSRRFERPPSSPNGGYLTVDVKAKNSFSWDDVWTITNGDTTLTNGAAPFAVLLQGNYLGLIETLKPKLNDPTSTARDIFDALDSMKAELDSQKSGGSPKALG